MAQRIWPGTRALAQWHLDEGQRVWLVTAAPIEIASVIARRLGLTGAMGTVAEQVDGVYTGELVGELLHGEAKAEAVQALAAREGLDLARCSAYSDSSNDLPMLSLVGDPCAVNPDSRLRAHAKANGWRIRDYRTGRKAARAGLVAAAVAGAVSGAVAAGVSVRGRGVRRPGDAVTRSYSRVHTDVLQRPYREDCCNREGRPHARLACSRTASTRFGARCGLPSRRSRRHGWPAASCSPRPTSPGSACSRPAAAGGGSGSRPVGDEDQAASSEVDEAERERLIALVELARNGDKEAFGLLYDHYQASVYRFLYYRTRSQALAEDLTSETFFRALRSMNNFRWQGKDFGAWLMTIARNLTTDHFKAGRTRLEMTTEDMTPHDDATEGPENEVLAGLTNEVLLTALTELPTEQRECLIMRFLQGMSIAETAKALSRSDGAVKQLQLRGVRNLAKLMPEGLRD